MDNLRQQGLNQNSHRYYGEENREDEKAIAPFSTGNTKRKRTEQVETERTRRMARLRAENEQEETKLAKIEQTKLDDNEAALKSLRPKESVIRVDEDELHGLDEDDQMKMLLGFSGNFASTKGQSTN